MELCKYNPQLLSHKLARELVEVQATKVDNYGQTALMKLFSASRAEDLNYDSQYFRLLYNHEKNIIDKTDMTMLMYLCRYNPKLITRVLQFSSDLFASIQATDINGLTAKDYYHQSGAD